MKYNRLFITGDTHGNHDIAKLYNLEKKSNLGITKDDVVLICGDWGAIWNDNDVNGELINRYKKFPWTTIVVLGNHENYNAIFNLPKEDAGIGADVYVVEKGNRDILILQRGEVYQFCNEIIWTCGGGVSIDKQYRTINKSWWPQEYLSASEKSRGIKTLEQNIDKITLIATHTAPEKLFQENLFMKLYPNKINDEVSMYLNNIYEKILTSNKPISWFYGHYHNENHYKNKNVSFQMLYNTIVMK